jgi:hypothetical protein
MIGIGESESQHGRAASLFGVSSHEPGAQEGTSTSGTTDPESAFRRIERLPLINFQVPDCRPSFLTTDCMRRGRISMGLSACRRAIHIPDDQTIRRHSCFSRKGKAVASLIRCSMKVLEADSLTLTSTARVLVIRSKTTHVWIESISVSCKHSS